MGIATDLAPSRTRATERAPWLPGFSGQEPSGATGCYSEHLGGGVNFLSCLLRTVGCASQLPAVCGHASQWRRTTAYAQPLERSLNLLSCPDKAIEHDAQPVWPLG